MKLTRWAATPHGVFGTLEDGDFECYTVERPWKNNQPSVSCIPEGTYTLKRDYYHRGRYEAFEIRDVPGRSRILIHTANTMDDIKGCIGPGKNLGLINGKWAVTNSKDTYARFMRHMDGTDETQLSIEWSTMP